MYISEMKFRGFKSFKKADVSFSNGFVCLAGPNGSGKSNVIDAIRFSLGEMSLKSLRARKVSELINKYCSKGEVTLVLNGEKRYEVRREIRGDGKVKYRLNGKRVTRTALLEAMRPHGLEGNHNIIAQGQVERIIEMNPKERREIIDGVAGISEFEEKKKETLSELGKVEQKISDASLVIGERKAQLTELEKERNGAIEYSNASTMLKRCRASLVHIQLEKTEKQHTDLMEKYMKAKGEGERVKSDIAILDKRIGELEKDRAAIVEKIGKGKAREGIFKEVEELKVSIAGDRSKADGKEGEMEKIKKRIGALEEERKALKEKLSLLGKEMEGMNKEAEECGKALEKMGAGADEKKLKEIALLKEKAEEMTKAASEKERKVLSLETEVSKLEEINKIKKEEMERVGKEEKIGGRKEKEGEREKLKDEIETLAGKLDALFDEEKKLNAELKPLESRLLEIKEKLAAVRATSFQLSPALLLINEMKKKESGIYGTVYDIVKFDQKYEIAIEAACGQRLSYVVVDNIDTATKAIEELKRRKAGRCTFIPIDRKVLSAEQEGKQFSSSGIGMLIDLVSFDRKFYPALHYVFGDTLLVESVEAAKKTGIGKVRMVTKEGELLERSGVITGGFLKPTVATRAFFSLLEKEEGEVKERREFVNSALYEKREEMTALRRKKMENEVFLKNIEMEMSSGEERWKERAKALEELKTAVKKNEGKMEECREELASLREEIENNGRKRDEIVSKIKHDEEGQRKEESESSKKITDMREKKSSLEASIGAKKSELTMFEGRLKTAEGEAELLKKEEKEIGSEVKEIRKRIAENEKAKEEKEEKLRELSSSADMLYSKLKEIEDSINAVSTQKGTLCHGENKNSGELQAIEMKKAMAETKLVDLKTEFEGFQNISLIDTSQSELEEMGKKNEVVITNLGNVNMKAPELYDEKKKDIDDMEAKINLLKEEKDAVMRMMEEIEEKKRAIFMETLDGVSKNFKSLFSNILRGEGFLLLEKPSDPFSSGLFIKIKDERGERSIDALSGGEKSLLALVFIFAIQLHKPAPFYILDEADAALDKENSRKLVQLLEKLSKKTQFILATHNDTILSSADIALGVTMTDEGSKIVGVQLTRMKQKS